MKAYLLETLLSRGWRRGGEIYWTQDDADRSGRAGMKRKSCRGFRILEVDVQVEAIAEVFAETEYRQAMKERRERREERLRK